MIQETKALPNYSLSGSRKDIPHRKQQSQHAYGNDPIIINRYVRDGGCDEESQSGESPGDNPCPFFAPTERSVDGDESVEVGGRQASEQDAFIHKNEDKAKVTQGHQSGNHEQDDPSNLEA
jgi:hypothetical protein